MKTKLFQVILILAVLGACKSKEEKANELIKDKMFKTLYDFTSYEPVETKIDSAFSSIYRDSLILDWAISTSVHVTLAKDYLNEAESAKDIMDIWSGGYSSYSSAKWKEAYNDFQEKIKLADFHLEKIKLYSDSIKTSSESFVKEFIGWQATHLFRAKTKGGQPDLATYIYIFDPKVEKILHSEDSDDEDLKKYRGLIDEAIAGKIL